MRKLVNRNNYKPRPLESIPMTDNVDRSGYIPLDVQYARMMTAGAQLEATRDYMYNVDIQKVNEALEKGLDLDIDKLANSTQNSKLEKTDLDEILKNKLKQYKRFKDKNEELKVLQDRYKQLEREKAIRQEAVNQYKEQLYRDKLDSQS